MLLYNFFMIVLDKLCKCFYLPKLKTNGINAKFKLFFSDENLPNCRSRSIQVSKTDGAMCGSLSRG